MLKMRQQLPHSLIEIWQHNNAGAGYREPDYIRHMLRTNQQIVTGRYAFTLRKFENAQRDVLEGTINTTRSVLGQRQSTLSRCRVIMRK